MYPGLHLGGAGGGAGPLLVEFRPPLELSVCYNIELCFISHTSKTPIPQYNLSVKVVPENAPDSISDSLKTKISWGGMPPDPPRGRVLSHGFMPCPPYFYKT